MYEIYMSEYERAQQRAADLALAMQLAANDAADVVPEAGAEANLGEQPLPDGRPRPDQPREYESRSRDRRHSRNRSSPRDGHFRSRSKTAAGPGAVPGTTTIDAFPIPVGIPETVLDPITRMITNGDPGVGTEDKRGEGVLPRGG